MKPRTKASMHKPLAAAQRGVTLVFALITLVALSLAAVALIRSVDTGALILGNLGFKQDAQAAADDAARAAIKWLSDNVATTTLRNNSVANGYYAAIDNNLDPTGTSPSSSRVLIDWDLNDCAGIANFNACLDPATTQMSMMGGKVTARYLIMRLCNGTGDSEAGTLHCARALNSSGTATGDGNRGSCGYQPCPRSTTTPGVYYRILVRAKGGRDTVAFTETLVHF